MSEGSAIMASGSNDVNREGEGGQDTTNTSHSSECNGSINEASTAERKKSSIKKSKSKRIHSQSPSNLHGKNDIDIDIEKVLAKAQKLLKKEEEKKLRNEQLEKVTFNFPRPFSFSSLCFDWESWDQLQWDK